MPLSPTLLPGRQLAPTTTARWSYASLIPRAVVRDWTITRQPTVLETLRQVCDRDPDASQALTNLLLFMGRGYQTTAYADAETVDDAATALIRAWDAQIGQTYGGGMDNVIDVLNSTLIAQGAMAVELEIAADLRSVVDIHPINPSRIVLRYDADGHLIHGTQVPRGTPGADATGFLVLSPRQFRYIPLHPWVDDPYGRSLFLSALTAIFFKAQLLADLQAVVHNQGYPRLDVTVVEAAIIQNAPDAYKQPGQEAALAGFVQGTIASIQTAYQALEPDDTFIHTDSVQVGYTGPPAGQVIDFNALRALLDTQIIAGLKHLPSFLGRNEGSSSTHATVQLQAFALLVESLQRRTKRMIEWAHTTVLALAGMQARVHVTFESIRASERLTDAQALESETRAHATAVTMGWETNDQAAQAVFGHAAAVPDPPTAGGAA